MPLSAALRRFAAGLIAVVLLLSACSSPELSLNEDSPYGAKAASRDGIGKVYLGREIAQVMGHQGAYWLERSSRRIEERPDQAIDLLNLPPDAVVADIGAGTGYFSFRLAPRLSQGEVLAVDLQPEMLALMNQVIEAEGVENVTLVQGAEDDPHLPPETVDLALMVDAYHEFAYPYEMMRGIVQGLKPGGQVVLAEYRAENPLIQIKRLHKMSQRQVKREMAAVGLGWQKTDETLPQQHLMFFQKPKTTPPVNATTVSKDGRIDNGA